MIAKALSLALAAAAPEATLPDLSNFMTALTNEVFQEHVCQYLDINTLGKMQRANLILYRLIKAYLENQYIHPDRIDELRLTANPYAFNLPNSPDLSDRPDLSDSSDLSSSLDLRDNFDLDKIAILAYNHHKMILNFSHYRIEDKDLRKLVNFQNLRHYLVGLKLGNATAITSVGIRTICTNFLNINVLQISRSSTTNHSIKTIAEYLPGLQLFSLRRKGRRSDLILPAFENLTTLELSELQNTNFAQITGSIRQARNLRNLGLKACNTMKDTSLIALVENLPELVILDLSCCHEITAQGLLRAVQFLENLQEINIAYCCNIRLDDLQELVERGITILTEEGFRKRIHRSNSQ